MTNEERKKVIETLLVEKKKVELKIVELKELTRPISPENSIGRISRMDAINNKSINEAALKTAQTKLRNIEISLERTGEKDFGNCRQCGTQIPIGRLLVMPGSNHCVGCARRKA